MTPKGHFEINWPLVDGKGNVAGLLSNYGVSSLNIISLQKFENKMRLEVEILDFFNAAQDSQFGLRMKQSYLTWNELGHIMNHDIHITQKVLKIKKMKEP